MKTLRIEKKHGDAKWGLVALILLLCVAGFLRMWNLGVASFWVDEVNTVFAADSWVKSGELTLPSGSIYGRARVHTYIVALFYRFFGVSETTSRLPSALFGLLSIIVVYSLARRVFDDRVALLSAFLMTFSHFEVGWSRTTRMYPLLQFLTLCIVWCFFRGFEKDEPGVIPQGKREVSPLSGVRDFFDRLGISQLWLLVGLFLVGISTQHVHLLTLFLLGGIWGYLAFRAVGIFFVEEGSRRFLNKYAVTSVLTVLGGVLVWAAFPGLRETTRYFLSYTPPWAVGTSTAQKKLYLFEFLISYQRFPLAAFFFVGGIQMITRRQQRGWLSLWVFLVPLFLLTFVFTHRVPTYLFFVYPFFLMIAAFGFVNVLESEVAVMEREPTFWRHWMKRGIVVLFVLIFWVSPWLRITLHIPFFEDGVTNLAVTPDEWREASRIVRDRREEGDLIVTSLPQVALYYGLRSDYGLNWVNLNQAKEKKFKDADGRWVDVYAGVLCIESLDALKRILQTHSRGWLLVTKYHLEHVFVIPAEVRMFIETTLDSPVQTKNGTVLIYHWSSRSEKAS